MPEPLERFNHLHHKRDDGCWEWTGSILQSGYGSFWADGQMHRAHRWAYERLAGPIPEGLNLDHLCRNRWCVNPDHLEAVTHPENVRRGRKGVLHTHCKHGHPWTPENLGYINGIRARAYCKPCKAQRKRKAAGA